MKINKLFLRTILILIVTLLISNLGIAQSEKSFDEKLLDYLDIKPGMIVADVGAGNGDFSIKLSKIVGLEGHVFASEIKNRLIGKIDKKKEKQGIGNLTTILSKEKDPSLPSKVDYIILKLVYHHLSQPDDFLENMLNYLKPGGRLAVIAKDINHLDPDKGDRNNNDPCISDPVETRKSIEKNGYRFEKQKNIENTRYVAYVLIFKSPDLKLVEIVEMRPDHAIYHH